MLLVLCTLADTTGLITKYWLSNVLMSMVLYLEVAIRHLNHFFVVKL